MKAQILKIAGVKSEKEFYKKYPSEEAFMKKHGKEFKKAQTGVAINASQVRQPAFKPLSYQDQFNDVDKMLTGSTEAERQELALKQQQASASQGGGGGGFDIGGLMKMFGSADGEGMGDMASSLGGARYGTDIPKAQVGIQQGPNTEPSKDYYQNNNPYFATNPGPTGLNNPPIATPQPQENGWTKTSKALGSLGGPVGEIIGGIGALKQEKEAAKAAKQTKQVSDISLQAAQSTDVDARRQMQDTFSKQRNAMMQPMTGENLFPVNGVGTNVLARNGRMLQGGGEIQNTFAPNDIYTDSGYEPLSDSEIVKQYYHGGNIPQAKNGFANWQNSMSGKGSGFSGAGGASGGTPWGAISHKATGIGQELMGGQNAGGQIGGTAGKAIGSIFGPAGGAIGEFVGGIAGQALDPYAKRIKKDNAATQRNMQGMANVSMAKGIQSQNQSYMEDGGWVSNDWQPQVIASFGGLDEQEVYDYAHEGMDTLRAGGHLRNYTPPSDRAMEIYEDGGQVQSYGLGGELQTHWGGGAETISRNPYLPGTGETVMFRGKSHEEYSPNGETGIGVTYGGNPVEVERGEPMVELEEGGTVDPETGEVQKSGVVFGNLKIPNQYIDMLGDKNAKGKKFKNYVNDLSKIESKQNTLIEKSTKELDGLTPRNSFDKLKLTALQASIQGANMKLKELADKKINAASLQNAINDTAEENGLVADDLARGKVKIDKEAMKEYAEYGKSISKDQDDVTTTDDGKKITKAERDEKLKSGEWKVDPSNPKKIKRVKSKIATKEQERSASAMDKIPAQKYNKETGFAGEVTKEKFEEYKKRFPDFPGWDGFNWKKPEDLNKLKTWFNTESEKRGSKSRIMDDPKTKSNPQGLPIFGNQYYSAKFDDSVKTTPPSSEEEYLEIEDPKAITEEEEKSKYPWWMGYANQALQYLRPSDQEGLDASQLYPEMYAMSTNQLEPVQANFYRPELGVPYDISLQDQLNANQADYRAAQRTMGYNPAAQANLNAQKYQANQGILGEQFRANQAMKDRVYGENRNILNDAKLKNLAIADQQYTRQAEAMSNTKATTQAALNSIADKYAKNKLENRELGVKENMYNYRYDSKGRIVNMNPLQQFNTEMGGKSGSSKGKGLAEGKGFTYDENGNIVGVRSIGKEENNRNGSIVKSYKNL